MKKRTAYSYVEASYAQRLVEKNAKERQRVAGVPRVVATAVTKE